VDVRESRFARSRGLIIFEMILYFGFLIWFLKSFLPLGLH